MNAFVLAWHGYYLWKFAGHLRPFAFIYYWHELPQIAPWIIVNNNEIIACCLKCIVPANYASKTAKTRRTFMFIAAKTRRTFPSAAAKTRRTCYHQYTSFFSPNAITQHFLSFWVVLSSFWIVFSPSFRNSFLLSDSSFHLFGQCDHDSQIGDCAITACKI